jgi:valyl-tRNA synthetase
VLSVEPFVFLQDTDFVALKSSPQKINFDVLNSSMKLYEITSPMKTYIARVKLKNGSTVTATERTESLSYARQIFQHKYGDRNVFNVSELTEQVNEIEEGTKTLTAQQYQVKSLADKAKQINQQKKQLQARQAMAKAQEKMRDANKSIKI